MLKKSALAGKITSAPKNKAGEQKKKKKRITLSRVIAR